MELVERGAVGVAREGGGPTRAGSRWVSLARIVCVCVCVFTRFKTHAYVRILTNKPTHPNAQ